MSERLTRAAIAGDMVMLFGVDGNAFDAFEYTPEALEQKARELREALGEATTVSVDPSPFVTEPGSCRPGADR